MTFRHIATAVALVAVASAATAGCAKLYRSGPGGMDAGKEAAPDSASIRIQVSNHNDATVRVFLSRGGYSNWIGTVAPMTSQGIMIPADVPVGAGPISIRVLSIAGQEWTARGIVPRGGTIITLELERDLVGSTWSVK